MIQNLDSTIIDEGSLVLIFNLLFLVLEYDFYLDGKGRPNHTFILLNSDKVISWYNSHDLNDIVILSGDYKDEQRNKKAKENSVCYM